MVEDFDVLGLEDLFLLCTLLKVSRQGINNFISFALSIINLKAVTRKFLSPINLFGAQTLCVYETAKVIIVSEYKYLILKAFLVVPPDLESFNNG